MKATHAFAFVPGLVVVLATVFLVVGGGVLLSESRSEVPHPTWALAFALFNVAAGLGVGYVGARLLLTRRRGDQGATARVVGVASWIVAMGGALLLLAGLFLDDARSVETGVFYGGLAYWLDMSAEQRTKAVLAGGEGTTNRNS